VVAIVEQGIVLAPHTNTLIRSEWLLPADDRALAGQSLSLQHHNTTATSILVVEKESNYNSLHTLGRNHNCILVCVKGSPDHAVRAILGELQGLQNVETGLPLEILFWGDCDLGAIGIINTLRAGLVNQGETILALPGLRILGLRASHVVNFLSDIIPEEDYLPVTVDDEARLQRILTNPDHPFFANGNVLVKIYELLLMGGIKMDIDLLREIDETYTSDFINFLIIHNMWY
jgi:DNA topoisomerase VI subunit A